MNDIVVGVDSSETALRAARRAAELANALGVNLHLVTCTERKGALNVNVGSDTFHVDPLASAEQLLNEVRVKLGGVGEHSQAVGLDDPGKFLCEEAERLGASMIVVGNRRVQGVARLLGSVANDVLRHAPCDVHIAHTIE
ncbi:MAG: universal stress protein [Ilumatobacter sp.]|nr:universal stress protein [Ilumatobacter sp.]